MTPGSPQRYVCIHGHFYQPPRENPWLEAIEVQDSAYPYHDWNERIDAECYAPNSASRILDGEGRITKIVNNYAGISFDFGPTLLSWMASNAPHDHELIVAADRESQKRFSGHGSAMAQAYNHMIMPLANRRDKYTQVVWGLRDFEHRFGRKAEGMWLPETAVDLETLDIMAECGTRFTVLSPYQALRVRPLKGRGWTEVNGGGVDPTIPYLVRLPSHRTICVFFYNGPVSRAVAFEHLLDRGEHLAGRLVGSFSNDRPWAQLAHIATDGETYGHHHRYGEMALSYALDYIERNRLARLANYGEFLASFPPQFEVQILEDSAWSCAHGVERWRSNCGCNSGRPGWNQEWRRPLRDSLDWLRDELARLYEEKGSDLLQDPWAARDAYIDVILDRSPENRERFLEQQAPSGLSADEKVTIYKLLEMQRHAMLMYTSCGWFFDDISGIETVQVIQYAARAIQLASDLGATPELESCFLEQLAKAKSNLPEHGDGRDIYEKFVRPAMVDLRKVGAHYAVSSLFGGAKDHDRIYCYTVQPSDYNVLTAGKTRLALGRVLITSEITQESAEISFGVLHLGDHNVAGGVRDFQGEEAYQRTAEDVTAAFRTGDIAELLRVVDKNYGPGGTYSLRLLFRDEQRRIIRKILRSSLAQAENAYRDVYQNNAALMRFIGGLSLPLPRQLQVAAEFTINTDLRREFESEDLNLRRIATLVDEAKTARVSLDSTSLDFALRRTLERLAEKFRSDPDNIDLLKKLEGGVRLARSLPFEVVLWHVQNVYYGIMKLRYSGQVQKAGLGDEEALDWVEHFRVLGDELKVRVG